MGKKLGKNAKLYVGPSNDLIATADAAGVTGVSWSEVPSVKDVKLSNSWDTWDGTTRGSGAVKEYLPTFSDRSITVDMIYDTADSNVLAIVAASYAGTIIPVLAMRDGSNATAGNTGVAFNGTVTQADEDQVLTEGVKFSVTFTPATDSKWVAYTVGT
jgi:hypothetical protein